MKENKDYQLVPVDIENEQAWDIRIISGEFNETVIRYGNVSVDGKDEKLHFNFSVILAPSEYITESNQDLQLVAADILLDVIENAIQNETVIFDDLDPQS